MYVGIKHKKKPCAYHKGKLCYIFAKGMCKEGYQITYGKKINRYKKTSAGLTQKEAFLRSYHKSGGRNFFTGELEDPDNLRHYNFLHVLAKKQYPEFKFYWRNIIIGFLVHHKIVDQGTQTELQERINEYPKENWQRFFELRKELLAEYKLWIKDHKGEYKI